MVFTAHNLQVYTYIKHIRYSWTMQVYLDNYSLTIYAVNYNRSNWLVIINVLLALTTTHLSLFYFDYQWCLKIHSVYSQRGKMKYAAGQHMANLHKQTSLEHRPHHLCFVHMYSYCLLCVCYNFTCKMCAGIWFQKSKFAFFC